MAIDALVRIDRGGAYANLVLPEILDRSELAPADRHFVTEMVYGTTRMRRACDHLVDRFLLSDPEPQIRAALRLGAYQIAYLRTPPHAAVAATVGAVRGPGRSMVNAILRRIVDAPVSFPNLATELSYPDWIVERLRADLDPEAAIVALLSMNRSMRATVRDDGYVQDRASQLVVDAVGARSGELVIDLCAAPGGKATGLASTGATVIAGDRRPKRVGLIRSNSAKLDLDVPLLVADADHPPFRRQVADRVLVDAPCSGLGSLRSRADARWRIDADAPARLAIQQRRMVLAAIELLRPGGTLVYSVCTLTMDEGKGVLDTALDDARNRGHSLTVLGSPGAPWTFADGIATLLPSESVEPAEPGEPGEPGEADIGDAMTMFRLRNESSSVS